MAIYTDILTTPIKKSVGGVTFSRVRTSQGFRTSIRTKPDPRDARTKEQLQERDRFRSSVAAARALGPGIYRPDWTDVFGALSGFNAVVGQFQQASRFLNGDILMDAAPDQVVLGDLQGVSGIAFQNDVSGIVKISWDPELSGNAQNNDLVITAAAFVQWPAGDPKTRPVQRIQDGPLFPQRQDGAANFDFSGVYTPGDQIIVLFYLRPGEGSTATGPSITRWDFFTINI